MAAIWGSKDGARAGLRVEAGGSEADGDVSNYRITNPKHQW